MDRTSPAANPIALAESRLRWLDRRQEVLARNISHADTPGYRARDLAPFAQHLQRASSPAGLLRTDPAHLVSTRGAPGSRPAPAEEVSPDGNGVSLDEQAIKVADTDSAHAVAMGLHRRWVGMYRTALGRNG
ncbi:flagellar basal-body rod protein FlgB [Roseomonas rosea]|uniref:Flagellar basal-body rod protein FlgB n=1 Tax=Muricoccus roseus TaxID=198092 RepID=A0A1M6E8R5_9PROT|nr:flagellar biosynthesis protein FlgB [Roseomonas rosea]SHI81886.1 flagellar basal-body rod protein FlgB [Roseomonas rosea]